MTILTFDIFVLSSVLTASANTVNILNSAWNFFTNKILNFSVELFYDRHTEFSIEPSLAERHPNVFVPNTSSVSPIRVKFAHTSDNIMGQWMTRFSYVRFIRRAPWRRVIPDFLVD